MVLFLLLHGCARSPYLVARETRFTDSSWLGLSSKMVVDSALTSDGQSLYFGSARGTAYRVDGTSGDEIWRREVNGSVTSNVLVHEGRVFLGTSSGECLALEVATGKILWKHEVTGEVLGSPMVLDGNNVLFGANNGYFYALEISSGQRVWQYKGILPNRITIRAVSTPMKKDGRVYVGFNDGTIAALNSKDGTEVWKKRLEGKSRFPDVVAPILMTNGRVLVAQFQGRMHALMRNGAPIWSLEQGGASAASLLMGDVLFVPGEQGKIFAVDPRSGAKKWEIEAKGSSNWSGLSKSDSFLLASSFEGFVHVIDPQEGKEVWRYNLGAPVLGPAIALGDRIWLLTRKGTLFGLEKR